MSDEHFYAEPIGPRGEWRIPANARPYKRTREFGEADTPAALRRSHATAAGVWAELVVLAGRLRWFDLREATPAERRLEPGRHGLIEPEALHRVEPEAGARFYVVFHRV